MALETDAFVERVKSDPHFQELVAKRTSLGWTLSIIMLIIYFGFIVVIAFKDSPALGNVLARPIAPGMVTTVGILVGVLVILSAFVLTAIYVVRANSAFDALTQQIKDRVK